MNKKLRIQKIHQLKVTKKIKRKWDIVLYLANINQKREKMKIRKNQQLINHQKIK